jgi:hypothetical protein
MVKKEVCGFMIIDFRDLEIIFKIGWSQEVRGILNFGGSVFQNLPLSYFANSLWHIS